MKSLTVSVFWPCWEWIRWPERRWLYASYAESLSLRDSRQCRILIQSPWYQRNWGDVFRLTEDQNEERRFENDKTGYRIASSVGVGTHHCRLLIAGGDQEDLLKSSLFRPSC